ncbi:MAG: BrnT family toxin [Thermoanaerobaculia bacterium]|nr:BrnT family toxin [Thermoanaerobaculia bacterium]
MCSVPITSPISAEGLASTTRGSRSKRCGRADREASQCPDPDPSQGESRVITFGHTSSGRLLVVAHREVDDDHIRIISARLATRREKYVYEGQV